MPVQKKQGLSQLDKKIIGILLIALLAIVFTASLSYFLSSQPNQTADIPSPMPTPIPTPTPTTPEQTPTPTNPAGTSANLVVNCTLKIVWGDMGTPRLKVLGSITNVGTETAYNVTIHVRTWFSDGKEAITIDHKLNLYETGILPPYPVNIKPNETYSGGTLVGMRTFEIPYEIRKDWAQGYVDNDCISTYQITASSS